MSPVVAASRDIAASGGQDVTASGEFAAATTWAPTSIQSWPRGRAGGLRSGQEVGPGPHPTAVLACPPEPHSTSRPLRTGLRLPISHIRSDWLRFDQVHANAAIRVVNCSPIAVIVEYGYLERYRRRL